MWQKKLIKWTRIDREKNLSKPDKKIQKTFFV